MRYPPWHDIPSIFCVNSFEFRKGGVQQLVQPTRRRRPVLATGRAGKSAYLYRFYRIAGFTIPTGILRSTKPGVGLTKSHAQNSEVNVRFFHSKSQLTLSLFFVMHWGAFRGSDQSRLQAKRSRENIDQNNLVSAKPHYRTSKASPRRAHTQFDPCSLVDYAAEHFSEDQLETMRSELEGEGESRVYSEGQNRRNSRRHPFFHTKVQISHSQFNSDHSTHPRNAARSRERFSRFYRACMGWHLLRTSQEHETDRHIRLKPSHRQPLSTDPCMHYRLPKKPASIFE